MMERPPDARRADGTPDASDLDVDGDGHVDRVLRFEASALRLYSGAVEATLAGTTTSGRAFIGSDVVRMAP